MLVVPLGPTPAALATSAPVGEDRLSSMLVFFFVALLIVGPFGYRRIRTVLRERQELLGTSANPTRGGSAAGATIAAPSSSDDLAPVIETIHRFAEDLVPGAGEIVELPAAPTVGGRVADPAVVVALVEDAARRSSLEISWDDRGRRAHVRRPD